MMSKKYWIGDLSKGCDICHTPFGKVMYDAQIPRHGMWGNLCRICFAENGCSTGIGFGQEYKLNVKSGKYELTKGAK
jgi:hypothetical protein